MYETIPNPIRKSSVPFRVFLAFRVPYIFIIFIHILSFRVRVRVRVMLGLQAAKCRASGSSV